MVYDGDCNFCRRWIARWRVLTGDKVDYAPFQEVAGRFPEIPKEVFEEAVQFVESNGDVSGGAEAVFRSLAYVPSRRWPLWIYKQVPGVAPVTGWLYRLVARHRRVFSAITRAL
jgi:predicted DCC family thiol-disulfide oxidoreductase YuxK